MSLLRSVGGGAFSTAKALFKGAKYAVTHYPKPTAAAVVAAGLAGGFYGMATSLTYSDGGRQGYVDKFSHKGGSWKTLFIPICTSWEGQLSMGNFIGKSDGSTSNTFEFSVLDKNVIKQVQDAYDNHTQVSLRYSQTYAHFPCWRDTDYVITSVRPINNAGAPERALAPSP